MKKVRVKSGMSGMDERGRELKPGTVLTVSDDFVVPDWMELEAASIPDGLVGEGEGEGVDTGQEGQEGQQDEDADKAALVVKAKALGINASSRWGVDTIREHIRAVLLDEAQELGIEGAEDMDDDALEQAVVAAPVAGSEG